ncbi:ataxin-10 isoform X2 [Hypomesus transpacificus]|uniref:ataxin-10 isoform X2 n=1 Tax=Hypomesus transpacificus TaxID=137520 RepID=UPI001F07791D|nr:ataxin-10 isoform X2 [Hypomesus transpacificus]
MALCLSNMSELTASINEIIKEEFSVKDLRVLTSLTTALREQEYRDSIPEDVLASLMPVLNRLADEIEAGAGSGEAGAGAGGRQAGPLSLQMMAECFRAQRNACIQNTHNQNRLRELGCLELCVRVVGGLSQLNLYSTQAASEALRCGLQFLGNVAVGNQLCKDHIWNLCFPDKMLALLSVTDSKAVGYASMVLHCCLDQDKLQLMAQQQGGLALARRVIELCRTHPDLDWTILIATQHFLKSPVVVESIYACMEPLERVTLLQLVSAQLGDDCVITPGVARFLATHFQEDGAAVLSLATASADPQEALVVISLLDVLCEMTSDHKEFMFLQDQPGLLKSTVELLHRVHQLGKTSHNVFTPTQDFSSSSSSSSSPSISFKAHLVRFIGNLSHHHTHNQNLVRDLEGIPLILDNCSIDSKNPFISQWVLFTLRNLLEQNPENQEVVAALEKRGPADDSALLNLGFRLEERDGSLLLKPVNKDKGND